MIKEIEGDIFEHPYEKRLDCIIHQCNLYHTFGSGIAAEIKKRFPYAYKEDLETGRGDESELGTYRIALDCKLMNPAIVNAYCQKGISATQRTTCYAAMGKVFFDLERQLVKEYNPGDNETVLGIPYKIGCGLGGGEWGVVYPIIKSVFENSPIVAIICRRKGD